ncbi:TatD family hydrolase [Spirochaetia bacterium]|nr:TatD family hydrolase [Spirochaetia bacterium]
MLKALMLTDAHCHPCDLPAHFPSAEEERRRLNCACAASSWNLEQFEYHELLARNAVAENAPPVIRCFAVHPQLPAAKESAAQDIFGVLIPLLNMLACEGRLDAIGEAGFDLYNRQFRDTEKIQDEVFLAHMETALRYGLPMVIHVRRAMHKIFAHTCALKKLPAVIFHSWPGTGEDAASLLRRGVNAYFSFGSPIMLNHKEAIRCCAVFPAERILLETDAPFQPPRGKEFSSWAGLPDICAAAAKLRAEAGNSGGTAEELEAITAANFFRAYGKN